MDAEHLYGTLRRWARLQASMLHVGVVMDVREIRIPAALAVGSHGVQVNGAHVGPVVDVWGRRVIDGQ